MTEREELLRFFKKVLIAGGVLLAAGLVVMMREVLVYLLIALMIAAALTPLLEAGEARRIPRAVTLGVVLLIALALLGLAGIFLLPVLVQQGQHLARTLPGMVMALPHRLPPLPGLERGGAPLGNLGEALQLGLTQGLQALLMAVTSLGHLALVLTFLVFIALDAPTINRTILRLLPADLARTMAGEFAEMGRRMARYVLGQLIISGILASACLVVLLLLHVPFALLLSATLGLFAMLPVIGPFLGMLPSVFIAWFVSPLTALWVGVALYALIHVVASFVAPFVYRRQAHLHPLVMLLALALGARLAGIAGAVVAVPVAAALQVLVTDLYLAPKEARERASP
ncbi:MAG TPA: AI-2E family transporter [Stenomitos sp.]